MFCQVTGIVVELQVLNLIDVMSFDLSAPVRTSSVLEVVDRELQSPGAVEKLTASGGNFEEFHYLRRFPWVDIHQGSSVKVKVERRLNVNSGANLAESSDRGIITGISGWEICMYYGSELDTWAPKRGTKEGPL